MSKINGADILLFSGNTIEALQQNECVIREYVQMHAHYSLSSVSHTLKRRHSFKYRQYALANSNEWQSKLSNKVLSNVDCQIKVIVSHSKNDNVIERFFKLFEHAHPELNNNIRCRNGANKFIALLNYLGIKGQQSSIDSLLSASHDDQSIIINIGTDIDLIYVSDNEWRNMNRVVSLFSSKKGLTPLESFYKGLADLWLLGAFDHWERLESKIGKVIYLPPYQFDKKVYPSDIVKSTTTINEKDDDILKNESEINLENDTTELVSQFDIRSELESYWRDVLGVDNAEDGDDFFELGGQSLSALQLANKIKDGLGVDISLAKIFELAIFVRILRYVKKNRALLLTNPKEEESKTTEIELSFAASLAQTRIFTAEIIQDTETAYNLGAIYKISGELDIGKLRHAYQELINRHDAFRTRFEIVDGELLQFVESDLEITLKIIDSKVEDKMKFLNDCVRPFNLQEAPLFRLEVYRFKDTSMYLLVDIHHIISDQTSIAVLMDELFCLYHNQPLGKKGLSYYNYVQWELEYFKSNHFQNDLIYWQKVVTDLPPQVNLIGEKNIESKSLGIAGLIESTVDDDLKNRLYVFAKNNKLTPYMVILSAFKLLIWKYTSQSDFIIGIAVAGRPTQEFQRTVGMFVNNLPMRESIDENMTVKSYLMKNQTQLVEIFERQQCPLEKIIELLDRDAKAGQHPLFNVSLNYVNMGTEEFAIKDLILTPVTLENSYAKFDITCNFIERHDQLALEVEYAKNHYKEAFIQRLIDRLMVIIEQIISHPDDNLRKISLLTKHDFKTICKFNELAPYKQSTQSITSMLNKSFEKHSDNVALEFKDEQYSYHELDVLSEQLAVKLSNNGITKGDHVGLLLGRGPLTIISFIALLKLGAVYVPIEMSFPKERIRFMLTDCKAKICLVEDEQLIKDIPIETLCLSEEDLIINRDSITANLVVAEVRPEDPIYIMYTSGSTGKPKGVVTKHKGVARIVHHTNYLNIGSQDIILQLSNYAFDGSTFDIYISLINGARLILIDEKASKDIDRICETIRLYNITGFFVTTALFNLMIDWKIDTICNLKFILTGGEAMSIEHAKRAIQYCKHTQISNVYGPTETTVFATFFPMSNFSNEMSRVPLGYPVKNTSLYVIDAYDNLLPTDIAGELLIGGEGVAGEYLNRSELTKERFIKWEVPLGLNCNAIENTFYKSGDRVKLSPDGYIEFLGRFDAQVKINGFRIEIGEVESKMATLDEVNQVIIIPLKDGEVTRELVAYYTLHQKITMIELKRKLEQLLPVYMIPNRLVELEAFKLNQNGKIDRNVLKKLIEEEPVSLLRENAQKNPILNEMSKILNNESLGEDDDFFNSGGQSIRAIALAQSLKQLGYQVTVNQIFQFPTARQLTRELEKRKNLLTIETDSDNLLSSFELGKIVNRIGSDTTQFIKTIMQLPVIVSFDWSINQILLANLGSQLTGFVYEGREAISVDYIKRAIVAVIKRHQLLHSYTIKNSSIWKEVDIKDDISSLLDQIPAIQLSSSLLTNAIVRQILLRLEQTYDLDEGLNYRFFILYSTDNRFRIVFQCDHVIFDGMSLSILKQDLDAFFSKKNLLKARSYSEFIEVMESHKMHYEFPEPLSLDIWRNNNQFVIEQIKSGYKRWRVKVALDGLAPDTYLSAALEIVKEKLMLDFNLLPINERIPIGLLTFAREYQDKSFYDCVGEFLDIVPVFLNDSLEEINNKLSLLKQEGINIVNHILSEQDNIYKELLSCFFNDNILKLIFFNFQGYISENDIQSFEKSERKVVDDNAIALIMITAYYDEDNLIVECQ